MSHYSDLKIVFAQSLQSKIRYPFTDNLKLDTHLKIRYPLTDMISGMIQDDSKWVYTPKKGYKLFYKQQFGDLSHPYLDSQTCILEI